MAAPKNPDPKALLDHDPVPGRDQSEHFIRTNLVCAGRIWDIAQANANPLPPPITSGMSRYSECCLTPGL